MTDIDRYRFFREYAGGIVGESALGALRLARVEELLSRALDLGVANVTWHNDDEPYEHGAFTADEAQAKFDSNEWTGPYGCVVSITENGDFASLWGIVVGPRSMDDPYCRVVVAELASELADDLRQAVGDALDAERHSCIV